MAQPRTLARRLAGVRDLAVGRAALAAHLGAVDAAAFAQSIDDLARDALGGVDAARDAMIVVASFVASAADARGEAALADVVAAAAAGELPFARAVLGARAAARSLPPKARLAEVGVATYAAISGLPSRRGPTESEEAWRATRAAVRGAPALRALAMRPLLERLRRHHDPRLIGRLLDQTWLRASDVVVIAGRRPTVPAIQIAIAIRDRWLQEPSVRSALAHNPFTPSGLAFALAATVPARDLAQATPPPSFA